jgi:nucleotide-binding universal stress UspA family protein
MARRGAFQIVVGTDGSSSGQAAVQAATGFSWPDRSDALLVVAAGSRGSGEWSPVAWDAAQRGAKQVAERALTTLRRRWPDARATCPARGPGEAIVVAARSAMADAVVVGFSGLGPLARLLMGSVSRHVVRDAPCSVLVVKGALPRARRFVLGVDGSDNARHAVEWMSALPAPPGGRVTLVSVLELMRMPSAGLMPASVRATLRAEARQVEAERKARAERDLARRAARLQRAGWSVRSRVREGVPLDALLDVARREGAEVLAIGARGTGGMTRLLLGSVAEGAITHAPMSVLVVRPATSSRRSRPRAGS